MRSKQSTYAFIAAFIWGTAFVAQSVGTDYLGPFTYNSTRYFIGAITLAIMMPLMKKLEPDTGGGNNRDAVVGGIICGILLTVASNLQQASLADTAAGKAGFLTALYIILVPALGFFIGKKVPGRVWMCVIISVFGLYFLCVKPGGFTVVKSDILLLSCSLIYAIHILVVDKYSANSSGVLLSLVQFITAGALSGVVVIFREKVDLASMWECRWSLLYVGVLSSGFGYTLQILAQKGSNPTVISLILSLESVFSVLAGAILLKEVMSVREYMGCGLMLTAVFLVQLPRRKDPGGDTGHE